VVHSRVSPRPYQKAEERAGRTYLQYFTVTNTLAYFPESQLQRLEVLKRGHLKPMLRDFCDVITPLSA